MPAWSILSDEWITERSGIKARHIAAEGEKTSDLGIAAAIDALNDAGIEPSGIDFIILATSTPDLTFPATATTIQASLGITHGFAFDLQAVCSGFAYALAMQTISCALATGKPCACHRRGNVLSHPRLGRTAALASCSAMVRARSSLRSARYKIRCGSGT